MKCVFALSAVFLLCGAAHADIRVVYPDGSGEWPTIQAAVEASVAGDVVELTDGTFVGPGNRDVDFVKLITIRSQGGNPFDCVVDCEGTQEDPHRGFLFGSGAGAGAVLEGLTITNGMAWEEINGSSGGGVCCGGASPVISNCRFVDNAACGSNPGSGAGGAVVCSGGSAPVFVSCAFVDNWAYSGGAMYCASGSTVSLTNCVFISNSGYIGGCLHWCGLALTADECTFTRNYGELCGSALYCWYGSLLFTNCTFHRNGCALRLEGYVVPTLDNTLIAFNSSSMQCGGNVVPALSCCDIYGNYYGDWMAPFDDQQGIKGNVCRDPLFCSPSPHTDLDWSIHSNSPCAPEFSGCGLIGAWGVGCGESPVRRCTWGSIKAMYLSRRSPPD